MSIQAAPDLWPPDFGALTLLTPVAILRQQGAALGEHTKNIVRGIVETDGVDGNFVQKFHLYCSPLGYKTLLLDVRHGIELYPAEVLVYGEQLKPIQVSDADALMNTLRDIFARPKTKNIIASLLAQSQQ